MSDAKSRLFGAFQEDHASLGKGFYEISTALRQGNIKGATTIAERMNREAGAHIVFEEEYFYPALVPLLGKDEVARLRGEHDDGLRVIRALTAVGGDLSVEQKRTLLQASEAMERHIAECGELFEAIGRISVQDQVALCEELLRLRRERPEWIASVTQKRAANTANDTK